jgi:MFS family permease
MTEYLQKKLNDKTWARWTALVLVSFTMMFGYFVTDVLSPLEDMLVKSGWTSSEYGFFAGSYGYINVFLLMLFFGGIILDKMGIRFTGIMAAGLMMIGGAIKYAALQAPFDANAYIFGMHSQVIFTSLGFAVFGVGCEIAGITVSKVIVKWFTGRELALAMGLQVGMARIGTALALGWSLPCAQALGGKVSAPVLIGVLALCIGLIFYLVYCVMDKKLDKSIADATVNEPEEPGFQMSDLKLIFMNRGFWLITLLCLLFYSGVFPFLKFATKLMMYKYNVGMVSFTVFGHFFQFNAAGAIPSLLPFGTILLTPIFGTLYDRIGKGATLMIIGSVILTVVHVLFALPILNVWWFAVVVMIMLGIAFSLVPSAMWPSVPKIIPMKQLGSAYAIIFYIQNIGLALVPVLIGWVIGRFAEHTLPNGTSTYDYTIPMTIFAIFGVAAIVVSFLLKKEDAKKNYGLEKANIEKTAKPEE